ncbi:MAG: hypothetical protein KIT76_00695 [Pseudolabrys sp.]|nr:hypothetical protein [Pseudolabrys sp.]
MIREHSIVAVVAVLATIGCVAGFMLDPAALMLGWLVAAFTVTSMSAGALGVLMFTYVVRGQWTDGMHRPLTAAAMTLPLSGLLFVPVLVAPSIIYPWASHAAGGVVSFKDIWLTPWFFALRTVIYFAVWIALSLWLRAAWRRPERMMVSACVGLIVYALTASIAGIDWLESLTPKFHSSVYGLMVLTFQLLAGFTFALVIVVRRPGAPTGSYGAILLSVLMMWAYNHAMQYIIIWAGNVPEEVIWYESREQGAWGVLFLLLIVAQFVLPFFALLSSRVRNGRGAIVSLAALTLVMRFVEAAVLAMPERVGDLHGLWLSATAAMLLAGAIWWMAFAAVDRRLAPHDLKPLEDDAFDASGSPVPRGS